MNSTGGNYPDLISPCLWRRECFIVCDRQFGGHVSEVIAPDIVVTTDFVEGGA